MTVKESFLAEDSFFSSDKMLKNFYFLNTLSKKEQYVAEIEYFEKKYGMKLNEFVKSIHSEKGKENFINEEDLEDWEFAFNALKWWNKKSKELKNA